MSEGNRIVREFSLKNEAEALKKTRQNRISDAIEIEGIQVAKSPAGDASGEFDLVDVAFAPEGENLYLTFDDSNRLAGSICYHLLPEETRNAYVWLLKHHPRYTEDFADRMPDNVKNGDDVDMQSEWHFQQAAIWGEMVRGNDEFDRGPWRYNGPCFLTEDDRKALEC